MRALIDDYGEPAALSHLAARSVSRLRVCDLGAVDDAADLVDPDVALGSPFEQVRSQLPGLIRICSAGFFRKAGRVWLV